MNRVPPSRLPLIRVAMLAGALAFGLAAWFVTQRPGFVPNAEIERRALVQVIRVEWAFALVAVLVLFVLARRARDARRVATLSTIAWAIGEGTVLLGGNYYFTVGDAKWYGLGLSFLVLTLVAFPARPSVRR